MFWGGRHYFARIAAELGVQRVLVAATLVRDFLNYNLSRVSFGWLVGLPGVVSLRFRVFRRSMFAYGFNSRERSKFVSLVFCNGN